MSVAVSARVGSCTYIHVGRAREADSENRRQQRHVDRDREALALDRRKDHREHGDTWGGEGEASGTEYE